jgi:hypothetical protein
MYRIKKHFLSICLPISAYSTLSYLYVCMYVCTVISLKVVLILSQKYELIMIQEILLSQKSCTSKYKYYVMSLSFSMWRSGQIEGMWHYMLRILTKQDRMWQRKCCLRNMKPSHITVTCNSKTKISETSGRCSICPTAKDRKTD